MVELFESDAKRIECKGEIKIIIPEEIISMYFSCYSYGCGEKETYFDNNSKQLKRVNFYRQEGITTVAHIRLDLIEDIVKVGKIFQLFFYTKIDSNRFKLKSPIVKQKY